MLISGKAGNVPVYFIKLISTSISMSQSKYGSQLLNTRTHTVTPSAQKSFVFIHILSVRSFTDNYSNEVVRRWHLPANAILLEARNGLP